MARGSAPHATLARLRPARPDLTLMSLAAASNDASVMSRIQAANPCPAVESIQVPGETTSSYEPSPHPPDPAARTRMTSDPTGSPHSESRIPRLRNGEGGLCREEPHSCRGETPDRTAAPRCRESPHLDVCSPRHAHGLFPTGQVGNFPTARRWRHVNYGTCTKATSGGMRSPGEPEAAFGRREVLRGGPRDTTSSVDPGNEIR